ncbi:MAG: hypothetical protein ACKVU4_07405 [Phycisphaerales bacterium]
MDERPRPCFFCGYDLRGVRDDGTCPECGRPARDAGQVLDGHALGARRTRWLLTMCLLAVFCGFVLVMAFVVGFD